MKSTNFLNGRSSLKIPKFGLKHTDQFLQLAYFYCSCNSLFILYKPHGIGSLRIWVTETVLPYEKDAKTKA